MVRIRIEVLRREYCSHCPITKRSARSTGVRLLEQVLDKEGIVPRVVIDYGCSTWRNSRYLENKYRCFAVRVDAVTWTKPDVVAYPTHMPFRDGAADVALLTHILMFMNNKAEWKDAINELRRISRRFIVLETYHVKNPKALNYEFTELMNVINENNLAITRRNVKWDMENLVLKKQ